MSTTSGSRSADELSIEIRTYSFEAENAILALLDDETPILVNVSSTWETGFDVDFYLVGDLTRTPTVRGVRYAYRDVTLPLTQTDSPIVDVENSGWSWAQLAAEFPTWDSVIAAFETWADVAANNRRPGF